MAEKDEKRAKDANREVDALKKRAEKYCEADEYDKAIAELTKALRIAPNDADLYKRRGDVHGDITIFIDSSGSEGAEEIIKSEDALAVEDYSAAIKLNPDDAEIYIVRGTVYAESAENYQKALADYNQAISIDPDMARAYYLRGQLYSEQNKLQTAMDDFNKAISLDKRGGSNYCERGKVYAKKGDWNNALADFRKAVKLDKYCYLKLFSFGKQCLENEEYQQAIDVFSECINGNDESCGKGSWLSYKCRADAYESLGNYEAAIADFNQVISIDPDKGDWYYRRGQIYTKHDNLQAAIDDFDKAISLGAFGSYYWERGEAYEKKGNWNNALADFEMAVKLDPENVEYKEKLEKAGNTPVQAASYNERRINNG